MTQPKQDTDVPEKLQRDLSGAYGDLTAPNYEFATRRLEAGAYEGAVRKLAAQFFVADQTSLGSDDVCVTLFVRLSEADPDWRWCVQLSLVGAYAVVGTTTDGQQRLPVLEPTTDRDETRLLKTLRDEGFDLLTYDVLCQPTALRPPNWEPHEICSVYNALFTFMNPWPSSRASG